MSRQTTTAQPTTQESTTVAQPATSTTAPLTTDAPATTAVPIVITVASITSSGTAMAGENYSLECSVSVTGSTEQPTIIWMENGAEINSSDAARTVSVTSGSAGRYSSILTFDPLAASHAGTGVCRATLSRAENEASKPFTVYVRSK